MIYLWYEHSVISLLCWCLFAALTDFWTAWQHFCYIFHLEVNCFCKIQAELVHYDIDFMCCYVARNISARFWFRCSNWLSVVVFFCNELLWYDNILCQFDNVDDSLHINFEVISCRSSAMAKFLCPYFKKYLHFSDSRKDEGIINSLAFSYVCERISFLYVNVSWAFGTLCKL